MPWTRDRHAAQTCHSDMPHGHATQTCHTGQLLWMAGCDTDDSVLRRRATEKMEMVFRLRKKTNGEKAVACLYSKQEIEMMTEVF